MDRAQKVDEKNEIICLVIMLTLGVIFIKMSHMSHNGSYFVFSADD